MTKLDISAERARAILYDDDDEFTVFQDEIIDRKRWSVIHEVVITDGKSYWIDSYSKGATENQDELPWEYEEPDFRPAKKVMVEKYVAE